MSKWIVSEKKPDGWREFAVVPAHDATSAILLAKRYGMRVGPGEFRAVKQTITKK